MSVPVCFFLVENTFLKFNQQDAGDEALECKEVEFEANECYCIGKKKVFFEFWNVFFAFSLDIRMSTGSGELKLSSEPTTLFKRDVDVKVQRFCDCFHSVHCCL